MTARITPVDRLTRHRWILIALALAALVAVLALSGWAHLLMPNTGKDSEGLTDIRDAIGRIQGPATATFVSLSGLGLLAGGAMTAVGMPQGIRTLTMSALAAGGVLLGNGLIA